ncbi:transposase [Clostridium pasteurianum BC1]|uniref:Transposase n=1 Tax=Clostridium pasteurianum BC1 TaxID=86416 RepID=R4K0V2_CLOPA|nr:transposase [Clostridium pasteurianum BC1]
MHSVEKMCKLFHVSRSGYYNWKNDSKCKRKLENEKILKVAQNSHDQNKGIYELDKMLSDVREKFPHCSRKRLYNIQKHNKLYLIRKRKFKATTYSNHNLPVANNLLNQNFNINKPNTVWVTDISYISTREGWLYLAAVKDICTKEIVGWATADNMKTSLCIKALDNAIKLFKPAGWRTHTPF